MITYHHYNYLKSRISQLIIYILPDIDPSLQYSDKDIDLIRAFYLLCHTEIEVYIENIIKSVAKDAYDKWSTNKNIITTIIFNLALNYNLEQNKKKESPYSMVCLSYKDLENAIEKNNGIKEQNIDGLLRYIGFEMDHTLKTTLNNYGEKRGKIAHKLYDPQNPLDPAIAKNETLQILNGLALFDVGIINYGANSLTNQSHTFSHNKKRKNLCEYIKSLLHFKK